MGPGHGHYSTAAEEGKSKAPGLLEPPGGGPNERQHGVLYRIQACALLEETKELLVLRREGDGQAAAGVRGDAALLSEQRPLVEQRPEYGLPMWVEVRGFQYRQPAELVEPVAEVMDILVMRGADGDGLAVCGSSVFEFAQMMAVLALARVVWRA